jgi:oxygen-independent coproporphyrinogen-3 oxidase
MEPAVPSDPLNRERAVPAPGEAAEGGTRREGPSVAARDAARAGLYVHVPFCATRCTYCDFATDTLTRPALERYLASIERECAAREAEAASVVFTSVFFGGGTPSSLSSRHFRQVWGAIRRHFTIADDAEITLEANPESVRDALLETWRDCGVGRLSMGAQTFDDAELRTLGRIHGAARPEEALRRARVFGFERLSLDLMFGFPGNDAAAWARTLDRALALEPEHLSAYCFIPEPGTPLGHAVLEGHVALPAPEAQADQYEQLHAAVEGAGLAAYETSNFCRPGGEARHNLVYWLRRPYLGLGPSAHGLLGGRRYGNRRDLLPWANALDPGRPADDGAEREDERAEGLEIVMLGLRLCSGLRAADYPAAAWARVMAAHGPALERAIATGRLERTDAGFRVPRGLRFVVDDVIAWIAAEAERTPRRGELTGHPSPP